MQVLQQNKKWLGLLIANGGVAVSVLFGAFQFVATYEQTMQDVAFLSGEVDELNERLVFVESQLQQAQGATESIRLLDDRVDQLDDFVVRWDEQSSMIMAEHEQFGGIVEDIWTAIDGITGERTRVSLPAGSQRGYGYD